MTWEYETITSADYDFNFLKRTLAELGKAGWELVTVLAESRETDRHGEFLYYTAFLKRPFAMTIEEWSVRPAHTPQEEDQ
jgi:hypothetical protein